MTNISGMAGDSSESENDNAEHSEEPMSYFPVSMSLVQEHHLSNVKSMVSVTLTSYCKVGIAY